MTVTVIEPTCDIDFLASGNVLDIQDPHPVIEVSSEVQTIVVTRPNELLITDASKLGDNAYLNEDPVTTMITGIASVRGFTFVDLSWMELSVSDHHAYTEVWRNTTDDVLGAVCVGDSRTQTLTDSIEPNQAYFYWFRAVSHVGNPGDYTESYSVLESPALVMMQTYLGISALDTALTTLDFDLRALINSKEIDIRGYTDQEVAALTVLLNNLSATVTDDLVQLRLTLEASNNASYAALTNQLTVLSTNALALAESVTTLTADLSDESTSRTAEITRLDSALVTANQAIATSRTELESSIANEVTTLNASLTTESTTRATQDSALAQAITDAQALLTTSIADVSASLTQEITARVTADSAQATLITTIESGFNTAEAALNARITNEVLTLVSADSTLASEISSLRADYSSDYADVLAEIETQRAAQSTENSAFATELTTLTARVDIGDIATDAIISRLNSVEVTADGNASAISSVSGSVNNPTTGLSAAYNLAQTANTTANGAASSVSSLSSSVSSAQSTANSALTLSSNLNQDMNEIKAVALLTADAGGNAAFIRVGATPSTSTIKFKADEISFLNSSNQQVVYWDTGAGSYSFKGRALFDKGCNIATANASLRVGLTSGNAYDSVISMSAGSGSSLTLNPSQNTINGFTRFLDGVRIDGTTAFQANVTMFFDLDVRGTLTNFTGSHTTSKIEATEWEPGDIVCDTPDIISADINNVLIVGELSSHAEDPCAVGIYNGKSNTDNQPFLNAVGEGMINVCGEAGDIAIGDLIVTSSTPGKGMKQSDDIIRSITVAKSRQAISFSNSSEVKQIACFYKCG